jgi:hypothetical protein
MSEGQLGSLVISLQGNIAEFKSSMDEAKARIGEFGEKANQIAETVNKAFAFVGVGIAIEGVSEIVKKFTVDAIEAQARLQDLAEKTNSSVETLSALGQVGKLTGTGLDTIGSSVEKLGRAMVDAQNGVVKSKSAFDALGISSKDLAANMNNPGQMMQLVAQHLGEFQNSAAKTKVEMDLFGKAGAELGPMLHDLADAGDLVAVTTTAQAEAADAYEKDLVRLTMGMDSTKNTIATALVPALDAAAKAILGIGSNSDKTKQQVADATKDMQIRIGGWAYAAEFAVASVINVFDALWRGIKIVWVAISGMADQIVAVSTFMDGLGAAMLKSSDPIGVLKSRYDTLKATLAANTQSNRDQVDSIVMSKTATQALSDSLAAEQDAQVKAMLAVEVHKKALVDTGGAVKAVADPFKQYIDQLKTSIEVLKANAAAIDEGKVKTDGATLAAAKYATEQGRFKDLAQPQKALILTLAAQKDAWESNVKAAEDFAAAVKKADEESLKDIKKYNQDKIDTVTNSTKDLKDLTARNNVDLIQDDTQRAQAQLQIEIDKWQQIIGLANDGTDAQKDLIASYNAWLVSQQNVDYLKSIKATADSIQSIMTDAFDNIFTHSKNIAQEIRDFFIKSFDKLVLTPSIQPIVQGLAGGVTSMFTGNTGASGSSASGSAAQGFSNAFSLSGGISALEASPLAIGTANVLGSIGVSQGVAVGLGQMVGVALPVIGAVLAIASMFGSHGGPKTGGNYQASYNPLGTLTSSGNNNTVMPDSQQNSQVQTVVQGIQASYAQLTSTLGVAQQSLSIGMAWNQDPEGHAGNMYQGNVSVDGKQVYNLAPSDQYARGDTAQQAMIDKMTAQMLTAAIVPAFTSVSKDLGRIAASFTGSLADTSAYLQGLATVAQYLKANPLQDALTQISTASQTAYQSLFSAGAEIKTMAGTFDGSLASVKSLSTATAAMYQSELAMIGQIQGMLTSLPGMFNTSIDTIKMSVMSNGDKSDYLRSKADADYAALGKTTDPARIQALATEINNLVNQAYGLKDSTGQATNAQSTQDYLSKVSDLVTTQLTAAQTAVTDLHNQTATAITNALGPVADKMETAADTINAAADKPVTVIGSATITVQVNDNTSQEVALFGSN